LKINGIGYKLEQDLENNKLLLKLGWSNWHKYSLPKNIKIKINQKTNLLYVFGNNKQIVGQITSQIRAFKKPEPYKGKGLSYLNEVIHLKEGKRNNV
jgi:large subunit ribosomal protein L6